MKKQLIFYDIPQGELDTILTTLLAEGNPIVLAIKDTSERSIDQVYNSFIVLNNYRTVFEGYTGNGGEIHLAPGENEQYIYYEDQ